MAIQRILLVALGITLGGCAALQTNDSKGWEAYQAFERQLENDANAVALSRHLSQRIMALFDQTSSDEEKRQFIAEVAYPLWISEKDAHFEKSTSDGDKCLTVNGLAQDGGPASVSVRYIQESGHAKAEEVHYELLESVSQYPDSARCPSEFSLEYPAAD